VKVGQYLKQAFEDVGLTIDLAIPDRPTSFKRMFPYFEAREVATAG